MEALRASVMCSIVLAGSVTQACLTLCDCMDCVACQAPLSMEFPRQEYWSGVAISFPRVLLTQGSNPHVLRLLISRQSLYHWATKEVPCVPSDSLNNILHSQDCVLENGSQDRNGGQSGYSKDRGGGKEILIAKVHLKDQPTVTFS